MYSKNRNSRASIYDFYGVDDAAYLMMLEEAAKVRKRRELFEASEKSKLQEIAENAWSSKGWCRVVNFVHHQSSYMLYI